jgi:hypothetical protein
MSMLLTLCSPVTPFSASASLDFPCKVHSSFPKRLSNHCQGLRHTFSEICTTFNAVPLSDPSRSLVRPDTQLQIKGRKNQHVHPAAWNFVHGLPRYASTVIYRCIAVPQLLTDGSTSPWSYEYPHVCCCLATRIQGKNIV